MTLDSDACRAIARSCFSNAAALLADAELLFAAHRHARTMSLSILGHEEMRKGFLYTLAALDLVPGLRAALERTDWHDPSRDHQFKQLLADMAAVAHHLINTFEVGQPRRQYPIAEVLLDAAAWVESTGAVQGGKERKAFIAEKLSKRPVLEPGTLPQGMEGSREAMKWRGVYVDVADDGEIRTPDGVSESAAQVVLVDLRVSLRDIQPVPDALANPEGWEGLKGDLQSLLRRDSV